jgi:hypothetical protein
MHGWHDARLGSGGSATLSVTGGCRSGAVMTAVFHIRGPRSGQYCSLPEIVTRLAGIAGPAAVILAQRLRRITRRNPQRNGFAVIAGGARRFLRRATKDGPRAPGAILRDAAQARGSSGMTAEYVERNVSSGKDSTLTNKGWRSISAALPPIPSPAPGSIRGFRRVS